MEVLAAIIGLEALKEPCEVEIVSDSKYLVNSVEMGWIDSWFAADWKKKGKDVPNADLWKRLYVQLRKHFVRFTWIKGHDGHPENERCDKLAVEKAKHLEMFSKKGKE